MVKEEGVHAMDVEKGGKAYNAQAAPDGGHPNDVEEFQEKGSGCFHSCIFWILSWALPGIGMFCESYFVFSIGNIKPLFQKIYSGCYPKHGEPGKDCDANLADAQTYIQIAAIMLGMLTMGFIADKIGRKWGSVTTATGMFFGGVLLVACSAPTPTGFFIMFSVAQFLFGFGVGGEYPLASSSAAERAESTKKLRFRRGEMIVCTFSMQGWGNLVNTAMLTLLMAALGQTDVTKNLDNYKLGLVWRLSFVIGMVPVCGMLIYRLFFLQESAVWKNEAGKKKVKAGGAAASVGMRHFWHRLVGTAGSWFLWDVSFYGNKLFQSKFITILAGPTATIITGLEWTLLNSFVALCGYYFSAFTIDKVWMGRVRLQNMGFIMVFICFLICAAAYAVLTDPHRGLLWIFQLAYFGSSFFGQFGPNATTWMLPGEVFPTEIRATCHGISAAIGKGGALVAGIAFNYVSVPVALYICAFFNLAGFVLTFLFIPNIMPLDLREGDLFWNACMARDLSLYDGEAVNPINLSFFERNFLKRQRFYKPSGFGKPAHPEAVLSKDTVNPDNRYLATPPGL